MFGVVCYTYDVDLLYLTNIYLCLSIVYLM